MEIDQPNPTHTDLCPTCFCVLTELGMDRNPLSVGCCKDITVTHIIVAAARMGVSVEYFVD